MNRIIKIVLKTLCALFLLFLCISFLTQCSLLYGNYKLTSDNLSYYTHNVFNRCFAGEYIWPAEGTTAVLNIPDTCEGYRVTALGGYVGSGAPCPFMVSLPTTSGVCSVCSEGTLPDDAQIEQYHLVVNIGRHLRNDECIVMDDYYKIGTNRFVQILVSVNCAPENPCFYSENGKLYKKTDDSPVDGFFYYSDYSDSL